MGRSYGSVVRVGCKMFFLWPIKKNIFHCEKRERWKILLFSFWKIEFFAGTKKSPLINRKSDKQKERALSYGENFFVQRG